MLFCCRMGAQSWVQLVIAVDSAVGGTRRPGRMQLWQLTEAKARFFYIDLQAFLAPLKRGFLKLVERKTSHVCGRMKEQELAGKLNMPL